MALPTDISFSPDDKVRLPERFNVAVPFIDRHLGEGWLSRPRDWSLRRGRRPPAREDAKDTNKRSGTCRRHPRPSPNHS